MTWPSFSRRNGAIVAPASRRAVAAAWLGQSSTLWRRSPTGRRLTTPEEHKPQRPGRVDGAQASSLTASNVLLFAASPLIGGYRRRAFMSGLMNLFCPFGDHNDDDRSQALASRGGRLGGSLLVPTVRWRRSARIAMTMMPITASIPLSTRTTIQAMTSTRTEHEVGTRYFQHEAPRTPPRFVVDPRYLPRSATRGVPARAPRGRWGTAS